MTDEEPTILLQVLMADAGTLMTTTIIDPDGHVTVSARPLSDEQVTMLTDWMTSL